MHKYPKLILLCLSFLAAYVLYHLGFFAWIEHAVNGYGYVSLFFGGLLFSFGFTTPFAIGVFVAMSGHVNPFIAAPVAGIGAVLADEIIFNLIRFETFRDEIHRLKSTRLIRWMEQMIWHDDFSEKLRKWVLLSFAGIIIASPFPDEFGVALMSAATQIDRKTFGVVAFFMNTTGILIILLTSRLA